MTIWITTLSPFPCSRGLWMPPTNWFLPTQRLILSYNLGVWHGSWIVEIVYKVKKIGSSSRRAHLWVDKIRVAIYKRHLERWWYLFTNRRFYNLYGVECVIFNKFPCLVLEKYAVKSNTFSKKISIKNWYKQFCNAIIILHTFSDFCFCNFV